MSGIEVARQMRKAQPALPIVFLSGHAERDILRIAMPNVRLLRKPFQSDELFAEVRRALGG
jgi:CheY-like chemotaxis protein